MSFKKLFLASGLTSTAFLELFGNFWYDFCVESGYDKILRTLGPTLNAFLENLDALHDHLAFIYPGMRSPSFRCIKIDSKSTMLHYYSERDGLEAIVLGIVKAVATKLHKRQISIEVKVIKNHDVPGCDHTQFLIEELDANTNTSTVSSTKAEDCFDGVPKISPETFGELFPFHVLFDEQLIVRGVGSTLARVAPILTAKTCELNKVFELIRPNGNFTFDSILSHLMTVYVLQSTKTMLEGSPYFFCLRIKGQMLYLEDQGLIIFLCSPSTNSIFHLTESALSLSDIPLHDASRDLLLLSETFAEEYQLARNTEILTGQLQQKFRDLEVEKRKTDALLYSVLPASVAIELRCNRPVIARKYETVTVMFCGLSNFAQFCAMHADEPIKVVDMLNDVYSRFDALMDAKFDSLVYKVIVHVQVLDQFNPSA